MTLESPVFLEAIGGDALISYSARQARTILDGLFTKPGVVPASAVGGGLLVSQRGAGANFSVDVAGGLATILGVNVTAQGKYMVRNTATVNVVISAPPGSGTRIDLIYAQVRDKQADGGSNYDWQIAVSNGTVGAGVPPATPNNAISLGNVSVTAGQASVLNSNITDTRPWACAVGGITVCSTTTRPANAPLGMFIYETNTGLVSYSDGLGNWFRLAAGSDARGIIARSEVTANSASWNSVTAVTILTVNALMEAGRRYKICSMFQVGNAGGAQVAGDYMVAQHRVAGTIKSQYPQVSLSAIANLAGNTWQYDTVISDATTGTQTVTVSGTNASGTGTHQILASASNKAWLTVEDIGSLT